jgi:hypothetical protein
MLHFFQARSLQYCEVIVEGTGAEPTLSCVTEGCSSQLPPASCQPLPLGFLLFPVIPFKMPFRSSDRLSRNIVQSHMDPTQSGKSAAPDGAVRDYFF